MESYIPHFVTLGLLFVLLLLLTRSYWRYKKKVTGFPFYNIFPYLVDCHFTGKISEDTPLNNVLFEELVRLGKQHIKEGLFMTYLTQPTLFIFSEEAIKVLKISGLVVIEVSIIGCCCIYDVVLHIRRIKEELFMTYFSQPIHFIFSETSIKVFANEKAALDKSSEYKLLEQVLGAGLVTSNGERWWKHRKVINPSFNIGVLKEKVPLFNEHAMALVKDIDNLCDRTCVDILDVLKIHYFNAVSESVLGLEQGEETKARVLKIVRYADNLSAMTVRRALYPWLRWNFILNFFPSGREFLYQEKECWNFFNNVALDMKKRIFSNKNEDIKDFGNHLRKSFTYTLLKHHLNDPTTFTLEDLSHEARTITAAGYDTVTYSTLWCLFLLGLHPEIQEKVYNEIQSTTSDHITYEESSNLTYLEAVLMETLRLYPAIPIFSRNLSEDIEYGKYKIIKGTCVTFFPYLSHRDPKVYPDPEKFEPERFLNSEARKTWSFIPFSEGSRSCIGKNYALIEMKIFLAHILRNFKFASFDRREDIKLCWTIILSPTKHLRFRITKRQNIIHHSS